MSNSNDEDLGVIGIDEDIAHKSNDNEVEFDTLIGHLQDVVLEDGFQDLQDTFLSQNCEEFEDEEDNKLIYTDIHNKYICALEEYLCSRLQELKPGFDMALFLSQIQSRRDEVDPELFDTLASLADFPIFKETMLAYKSQKDGEIDGFPSLVVTSLACGLPPS